MIRVEPSGQACGATVTDIDLSKPLKPDDVAGIRAAWLKHHVLAFPDQHMSDDDLERYTMAFGGFGDDPFIAPIPGRSHIIAVSRRADETSPLFAENWHSDWSFQARPPAGTCLYGITIPPIGGDTLFANQHGLRHHTWTNKGDLSFQHFSSTRQLYPQGKGQPRLPFLYPCM